MSTVLQNRRPCEKARQIPVIELDAPLHLAPALFDYFAGKTRAAFVTTGPGAALPKARGHFVSPCATVKSALWCLETVLSAKPMSGASLLPSRTKRTLTSTGFLRYSATLLNAA